MNESLFSGRWFIYMVFCYRWSWCLGFAAILSECLVILIRGCYLITSHRQSSGFYYQHLRNSVETLGRESKTLFQLANTRFPEVSIKPFTGRGCKYPLGVPWSRKTRLLVKLVPVAISNYFIYRKISHSMNFYVTSRKGLET